MARKKIGLRECYIKFDLEVRKKFISLQAKECFLPEQKTQLRLEVKLLGRKKGLYSCLHIFALAVTLSAEFFFQDLYNCLLYLDERGNFLILEGRVV